MPPFPLLQQRSRSSQRPAIPPHLPEEPNPLARRASARLDVAVRQQLYRSWVSSQTERRRAVLRPPRVGEDLVVHIGKVVLSGGRNHMFLT